MKRFAATTLALLFLAIGTGADYLGGKQIERARVFFSTPLEVTIFGSEFDTAQLLRLINETFKIAEETENHLSLGKEGSLPDRISRAAPGQTFELDEDAVFLLRTGLRISRETGGVFDITSGALKKVWDKARESRTPPSKEAIGSALQTTGYQSIQLDETNRRLTVQKEGVELNLDSLARGLVMEKIARRLKAEGITSAMIRSGGDIRVIGQCRENLNWRIGVDHPSKTDDYALVLEFPQSAAISTVNNFDAFFMFKGKRYPSFINAKTGTIPGNTVSNVTVIAKNAALGTALSEALFLLGPENGFELIERFKSDEVEAICVEENPSGKFVLSASDGAHPFIKDIRL
jgi:thiamine biosynthesis lipoprotein